MKTILIPKLKFEQMQSEIETLRKTSLYQRLLALEKNISEGRKFTRRDLEF